MQYVKAGLTVPVVGNMQPVSVKAMLDGGTGVMIILEEQITRMQAVMLGLQLAELSQGQARVETALWEEGTVDAQTHPAKLTVESPWGPAIFTIPFVVLLGPGNLVIISS